MSAMFQRTEILFGKEKMNKLTQLKVIIFGVGGVGSWCAESLIRSGIQYLTIVDSDRVCITNINRQLQATCATIGEVKVDVLKKRLLEINPKAEICAIQKIYSRQNYAEFQLENYDFIIDAIDSIDCKIHLIHTATSLNATFFSSLGAALKIDSTKIRVEHFNKIKGCPLGRLIRKRMRRQQIPIGDFLCVYSEEVLDNMPTETACGTTKCLCPKNNHQETNEEENNHEENNHEENNHEENNHEENNHEENNQEENNQEENNQEENNHEENNHEENNHEENNQEENNHEENNHEWCSKKAVINGSLVHITAIYGFTLAGLVLNKIYNES